jgi:DNA-directed RNA polymerase I and III subunit RPAC1
MSKSDIEDIRNRVSIHEHKIGNVSSTSFPNNYTGYDDSFNPEAWKKEFTCKIMSLSPIEMEFDLIGLDASIANAIRRFIVAEVPSICIEEVYSVINDGVMQDEVLAHRLGLIPLKIDARHFDFKAGEKTDLSMFLTNG